MKLLNRKSGNKAKKSDELIKLVDERRESATNWRMIRQIQVNRAFYRGDQWIKWDNVRRMVYIPEPGANERRYTYNKIKPLILTLLAKLTKNQVQLEVLPDTNDDDRLEVARAGQKFLKYQWQEDRMDHKSRRLKLHMLVDGMPALKVFVDKTKGDTVVIDEDKAAELGVDPGVTQTGKICTLVVDQMQLFIDPTAEDIEDIRWVVHEFPEDVDEIKEKYGVEVGAEDIQLRPNFELSLQADAKKRYTNHAMVREYWEWPSSKYPEGRKITIAGGKVLDYSESPGENPWIFFPMISNLGTAIADGVVKDLTVPQQSYNVKRTAEAKTLEEMGSGKWMVPINSIEDEGEITDEIGGIVHYLPIQNHKPTRENGIEPGAGWQNAMERDEADMEDISGAHEISQGSVPSGVDTYGGLQLLVEQDETRLALAAHSYEEGIKKWGEKVLRLVKKHFPEEQMLRIVGENGEIEALTFSGADLSGNEVVDVVPGSSLPEVRAVKEAKIFQMWGAGMFVDPRTGRPDVRKVARMLGQSVASDYFDDVELDENKAKMEQREWEQLFSDPETANMIIEYRQNLQHYQQAIEQMQIPGVIPPPPQPPVKLPVVRDFYDHETHLAVHNRFRKGSFYDNLPPELQAIIDEHCAEHEQAIMAPIIQQQQQQMMAQQAQEQAKAAETAASREHQLAMKQMDNEAKIIQEGIRQQSLLMKGRS